MADEFEVEKLPNEQRIPSARVRLEQTSFRMQEVRRQLENLSAELVDLEKRIIFCRSALAEALDSLG
jgi:hypothetical protein